MAKQAYATTSIRVKADAMERVRSVAADAGVPVGWVIRAALALGMADISALENRVEKMKEMA